MHLYDVGLGAEQETRGNGLQRRQGTGGEGADDAAVACGTCHHSSGISEYCGGSCSGSQDVHSHHVRMRVLVCEQLTCQLYSSISHRAARPLLTA